MEKYVSLYRAEMLENVDKEVEEYRTRLNGDFKRLMQGYEKSDSHDRENHFSVRGCIAPDTILLFEMLLGTPYKVTAIGVKNDYHVGVQSDHVRGPCSCATTTLIEVFRKFPEGVRASPCRVFTGF